MLRADRYIFISVKCLPYERQFKGCFNRLVYIFFIFHGCKLNFYHLCFLLALHRCWFESQQGLWNLSCEEAIQLAYRTSVVLLRSPFVPEIMHGRAPEVFLHQLSLNVAIWQLLCRCNVKPKIKIKTNRKFGPYFCFQVNKSIFNSKLSKYHILKYVGLSI
jgi:hypothetical protein